MSVAPARARCRLPHIHDRLNDRGLQALSRRAVADNVDGVTKEYFDLTRLIERLHRRLLDVVRAELIKNGINEINAVQAMLLANIGDEEIVIRDLTSRGYYLGSNVSYNIKKLVEFGYLNQTRSPHDKRSFTISLTERGTKVCDIVNTLQSQLAGRFVGELVDPDEVREGTKLLRRLERSYTDYIDFGDI
jgi:DNA-binding MarR family transcriptional regulator